MKHPVRALPKYRGSQCLNCQTPLDDVDKYCHQCGQLNSTKKLALSDFFYEMFANFISYDNKIWRTISGVLFKPGKVTKEYCTGKRMSYANPFRFFLSVSIVFFLLGQLVLDWDQDFNDFIRNVNNGIEQGKEEITNKKLIKNLHAQRDSLERLGNTAGSRVLDQVIKDIDVDTTASTSNYNYRSQKQLNEAGYFSKFSIQIDDYKEHNLKHPEMTVDEALADLNHDQTSFNKSRYLKAMRFNDLERRPYQILEIVVPKVPLFLFAFAPIISLFLWLIYVRHSWNFMEHMVFTFHVFTFFFLMLFFIVGIASISFGIIPVEWVSIILLGLIGPFYLYKAMRNFYGQGRFKTILKFAFLNVVFLFLFSFSAGLFLVGSLLLGV